MDGIFSTEQVAARYQTSPLTVADWRYKGTGPAYFRAGKRVLYREADLVKWEADQAREQAAKRAS